MTNKPDLSAATTSGHNKMMGATEISVSKERDIRDFKAYHKKKQNSAENLSTTGVVSKVMSIPLGIATLALGTLGSVLPEYTPLAASALTFLTLGGGGHLLNEYAGNKALEHEEKSRKNYNVETKELCNFTNKHKLKI